VFFVSNSETSNFVADPYSKWRRLESRRPSPIGIVMDSDGEDDVSVASTPVRLHETDSGTQFVRRRTRSLDDFSILDSLSDIIVSSDNGHEANISPIAMPPLGKTKPESPGPNQTRRMLIDSLPPLQNDSPTNVASAVSPDHMLLDPDVTWFRNSRVDPETPTLQHGLSSSPSLGSKAKQLSSIQEQRNSFWNRSPIAKGVKDAIWSKRSSTPTRNGPPSTPTRAEIQGKRAFIGGLPPSTPTRVDVGAKITGQIPITPRLEVPALVRRNSSLLPLPSTPSSRLDLAPNRRASTPTRFELMARRFPTPTNRGDQSPRRSISPNDARMPMRSNSEDSHNESRRSSMRSRSESFGTAQGSIEEEDYFEFRAQRIGKLGLVINSSPQTGPMVEQVKDYSTLFGRIHAGDRIVEVDGVETCNMSIKDVTKRLAGKYGIRTAAGEVRIKVARIRERDWQRSPVPSSEPISFGDHRFHASAYDGDDHRSVHSEGSAGGSEDSFYSYHRRNYSDPDPILHRLALDTVLEQRHSYHSKSGEEV
jgi:hypothetical protein